jgi:FkbM family methyltransferase
MIERKFMPLHCPAFVFRALNLIERKAAYLQGKGYGAATISQEVDLTLAFVNRAPKIAIDIGGNIGDYTAELRGRSKNIEIHVFEPSQTNIHKLESRFMHDPLVNIVPVALSNVAGSATLYSNEPGSGLASLTHRKLDHFGIPFDRKEAVTTIRFEDYWINHLNRQELDLVKIDIEGNELNALVGFGNALHATKVLQFEFGGSNIDTKTYFQDFWYFFQTNRFDLFRITPLGAQKINQYSEGDELFRITNYMAVNRQ